MYHRYRTAVAASGMPLFKVTVVVVADAIGTDVQHRHGPSHCLPRASLSAVELLSPSLAAAQLPSTSNPSEPTTAVMLPVLPRPPTVITMDAGDDAAAAVEVEVEVDVTLFTKGSTECTSFIP